MPVGERNGGIVKESSFSRVELMKKLSGDFFLFFGVLLFVRLCCTYESRTASVKRCLQDYAL